jgi:hypothetical protein
VHVLTLLAQTEQISALLLGFPFIRSRLIAPYVGKLVKRPPTFALHKKWT